MMECENFPYRMIFKKRTLQGALFFFVLTLISNLNAIVDSFLHPEIPYFDDEHIIVGGVTGAVSAILFWFILLYARHLERALGRIKVMESFLPICSNCKKIRISDTSGMEAWQAIESYITEHTTTQFSHGICPDCIRKLYPDLIKEKDSG